MGFLYFLIAILVVAIILFVIWFISYKNDGKCPICALQKLTLPTKITMDIENEDNYNNGAAKTPPMGWSSWNTFRNNISEELILDTADAMKKSGLLDAGYQYVNLDDCWQSSMRDRQGRLQSDFGKFPSGISSLVNKINSMGMKVGIYSSNGTLTCEDLPASLGNEELDAQTIANWGCEFFKYDFCHHKIISGDAPAIEGIELSVAGNSEKLTLYADDAKLDGKATIVPMKDIPSKKAIGHLNHGAGSASFYPEINVAGKYILTLLFCKSKSFKEQYLQIIVNGQLHEAFFAKSKAFSPNGRMQIEINLKSGTNEIVLKNPVITKADSSYIQYKRMGDALKKATADAASNFGRAEKPITYSICEWGNANPWHWGAKAGNMWRTTPDILPNWFSIIMIYENNIKHYNHAGVGAWNDPDMLEVGNGKLTEDENKSHFSLWCMMAAPLILGNDVRKFVDDNGNAIMENPVLKIVTNKDIIAVDQDPLGKPAKRFKKIHGIDCIARPLANGDIALCMLNKGSKTKGISFDIEELANDEYLNFSSTHSTYNVQELWSSERFAAKTISATLSKHACKVYRISAK